MAPAVHPGSNPCASPIPINAIPMVAMVVHELPVITDTMLHIKHVQTKKKLVVTDQQSIILWHLPKNMTSYVKILVKEFFTTIKLEIMDCCQAASPTDDTLETILQANWEDSYYEEQY